MDWSVSGSALDIDGILVWTVRMCWILIVCGGPKGRRNRWKPEFWLMGEVIHGDYSRWVNPEMLHSVTNYELHRAIYSAHNSHNYFEMAHTLAALYLASTASVRAPFYITLQIITMWTGSGSKLACKADLLPVYVFLYTIHGIPSVYYGSEFGMEGRRTGRQ